MRSIAIVSRIYSSSERSTRPAALLRRHEEQRHSHLASARRRRRHQPTAHSLPPRSSRSRRRLAVRRLARSSRLQALSGEQRTRRWPELRVSSGMSSYTNRMPLHSIRSDSILVLVRRVRTAYYKGKHTSILHITGIIPVLVHITVRSAIDLISFCKVAFSWIPYTIKHNVPYLNMNNILRSIALVSLRGSRHIMEIIWPYT